jgi:hypothetical protein
VLVAVVQVGHVRVGVHDRVVVVRVGVAAADTSGSRVVVRVVRVVLVLVVVVDREVDVGVFVA